MSTTVLGPLKTLFNDSPDVLRMLDIRALTLSALSDEMLREEQRKHKFFGVPINVYATGRTGAGKTSVGNLLFNAPVLKSDGSLDCTSTVQYFKMQSNLCYFDLPGSGSSEAFENINRATLSIEQLKDKDVITEIPMRNFTDYHRTKTYTETRITVADWQASENRKEFFPDIILYVIAPHESFSRIDTEYLKDLLGFIKTNGHKNLVFVFNIHELPDGQPITKPKNLENVESKIKEVYAKVYLDTIIAPVIVKINALTGIGFTELTEQMCNLLPNEKLGQMGSVLHEDLKAQAKSERSRRYRDMLIKIASRVATYKVDYRIGSNSLLLHEMFSAVLDYGMQTFHPGTTLADVQKARRLTEDLANTCQEMRSRNVMKTIQVTEIKHKTESRVSGYRDVYEDTTETRYEPENYTEKKESIVLSCVFAAPALVTGVVQGAFTTLDSEGFEKGFDNGMKWFDELVTTETTKTKFNETKVSVKKHVRTDPIYEDVVVQVPYTVEKQVLDYKEYLLGGYEVIKNLLAIGIGIEKIDSLNSLADDFQKIYAIGSQELKNMAINEQKIASLAGSIPRDDQEHHRMERSIYSCLKKNTLG